MYAPATAAALFATEANKNAEIESIRTVRAGVLGKVDITIWKVKGQRNRFFYTVEGQLKYNSFVELMITQGEPVEYYFERDYTNTIRATEDAVKTIVYWAEKLEAIKQAAIANPVKAAIQAKNGMLGPHTVAALEYFAYNFGLTPEEQAV